MRDKRSKFIELAEKRVNRAIEGLRLIGNLANRSNYEFDEEDLHMILAAVEGEVKALKVKFQSVPAKRGQTFRLQK